MKKVKNRILENPTNFAIILISLLAFVIGIYAIGLLWSILIVGLINFICFFKAIKKQTIKLINVIKKKKSKRKKIKEKEVKRKNDVVYEYKVDKKIVSNKEVENMKKTFLFLLAFGCFLLCYGSVFGGRLANRL